MEDNINEQLKKLNRLSGSPFPILSVYLGQAQKKSPASSQIYSQFHSLVHQNLDTEGQKIFKEDIERIDSFLRYSWDTRGKRSVVIFSSGKKLWEILEFEFYLPPQLVIEGSPYTKPIQGACNNRKKYLVLLADHEKARIFTVHLGRIEEHTDIFGGNVPQRVKHGDDTWDQQDKILRHIENHLHQHLERIAQKTNGFIKNGYHIRYIIVGGHKEIIPKIKNHLTWPANKLVLGQFVTELNVPLNEIFLKSKKVAHQIEFEDRR